MHAMYAALPSTGLNSFSLPSRASLCARNEKDEGNGKLHVSLYQRRGNGVHDYISCELFVENIFHATKEQQKKNSLR